MKIGPLSEDNLFLITETKVEIHFVLPHQIDEEFNN